jgi:hypothetical protein
MGGDGPTPVENRAAANTDRVSRSANYKNWNGAMQLSWNKCSVGRWCLLHEVDLANVDYQGVFVVWRNGGLDQMSGVLYVGRGTLRQEIVDCRRHPVFKDPGLLLTWARVDHTRDLDSVAAYLYQRLRPIWGEVVPSAQPTAVNLPLTA